MPCVTIQVGQCGNQLGHSFWQNLQNQCQQRVFETDSYFFKLNEYNQIRARCLLVDTEPKVVNSVLRLDSSNLFRRDRCFMGQSGRGNNWAFGYQQMSTTSVNAQPRHRAIWRFQLASEDDRTGEAMLLDQVIDGVRQEVEECDTAVDFLLMHSLAGGSGSGLGSKVLEIVREDYPLNNIATASVAPRQAGDAPMQSLNSVMALSFLQAYADVVMVFSNQDILGSGSGLPGGGGAATSAAVHQQQPKARTMADVNQVICSSLTGALWPLSKSDALSGVSRIRDVMLAVAPDPAMKFVETRTAMCHANTPASALWMEAVRALNHRFPRYDVLDHQRAVTSTGTLLLARGFSPATLGGSADVAAATYAHHCMTHTHLPLMGSAAGAVTVRHGICGMSLPENLAAPNAGTNRGGTAPPPRPTSGGARRAPTPPPAAPALTAVSNRSSVVGLLQSTIDSARAICQAGAYLHWYERYGCGREAVESAAQVVADVVDCYRATHRHM